MEFLFEFLKKLISSFLILFLLEIDYFYTELRRRFPFRTIFGYDKSVSLTKSERMIINLISY